MLHVNKSKARIDGKDINVQRPLKLPAFAGERRFVRLATYIKTPSPMHLFIVIASLSNKRALVTLDGLASRGPSRS